jgi:hypothetical protein
MGNLESLSMRDQGDTISILENLRTILGGAVPESLLREVGPLKISALSAPESLLTAVAMVAVDDGVGVDEFVSEVMSARQDEDFRDLHVTQARTKAGMSPQANSKLRLLLTAEPTLWVVRAEITPRGAREPTDAYEGIAEIQTKGGRRGASATFSPWGPFLSWERVTVDPVGLNAGGNR